MKVDIIIVRLYLNTYGYILLGIYLQHSPAALGTNMQVYI